MGTKIYIDPITSTMERFAWIFWTILWVSLGLGLGQEDIVYTTRGSIDKFEILSIVTVLVLWVSVIMQSLRQYFYNYYKPPMARIGNWLLLGATMIFSLRLSWLVLQSNYTVHMSPIILIGSILLGIGLALNALVGIKYMSTYKLPNYSFKV